MINGYRANDFFYIGTDVGYKYSNNKYYITGVGDDYYESFDGRNLIQAFVRVKANLTRNKISPFFQVDAGESIDVNSNKTGSAQVY